jgi:hypothetical protein
VTWRTDRATRDPQRWVSYEHHGLQIGTHEDATMRLLALAEETAPEGLIDLLGDMGIAGLGISRCATFRQAISYAAGELVVQERHRGAWREPLTGLSWPHLILRNGRRLLKPDVHGGRLAPVANRGELGAWLWGLGLDIGRKRAPRKA